MSIQTFSFQVNVEELVTQILMERQVNQADQLLLRRALLFEETLNEKERTLIDRVFYGVRHGLLRIVE
jgi:hypothetical protein